MSNVLVEFPVEEAEAMLKRLGIATMTHPEAELAAKGKDRLERAVAIERSPGGSCELPASADGDRDLYGECCSLVGRDVRIKTTYGSEKTGRLDHMRSFSTLVLETGPTARQPVPLACIAAIEAEQETEAAA